MDGQPAPLLRCNYIMRGVQVAPGEHLVEFRFSPSLTGLYVSVVAEVVALMLLGFLTVNYWRQGSKEDNRGQEDKPRGR